MGKLENLARAAERIYGKREPRVSFSATRGKGEVLLHMRWRSAGSYWQIAHALPLRSLNSGFIETILTSAVDRLVSEIERQAAQEGSHGLG